MKESNEKEFQYLDHLEELRHGHVVGRLRHNVAILEAQSRIHGGRNGGEGRQAGGGNTAGREQKVGRGGVVVRGRGQEQPVVVVVVRPLVEVGGGGGGRGAAKRVHGLGVGGRAGGGRGGGGWGGSGHQVHVPIAKHSRVKGSLTQDFQLQAFFMNHCSPCP
jgi:hypothetical protein